MDVSEIALRLVVVLMPGIISTLIVRELSMIRKLDSFNFSILTILLSGISYLLIQTYYQLYSLFTGKEVKILQVWTDLTGNDEIPYLEVLSACVVSIVLGFVASLIIEKKLIFKLAQKIRISNKYGDENLFYKFLGLNEINYIYVRDHEKGLIYHGLIEYYSETEKIREIVLCDVDVYDNKQGHLLVSSDKVFLSYPIEKELIFEMQNKIEDNGEEKADSRQNK